MLTTDHLPAIEKRPGRRVMSLRATAEFLVEMCKPKPEGYWWRCVKNTLPTDARLLEAHYDPDMRMVVMVLESAEWPEMSEGNILTPVSDPQFRAILPPPEEIPDHAG